MSIDGADAATHEWVRGVPGSFESARQAVINLAAAGIRPQIIFSVLRANIGQIDAMVPLAESLGANSIKFNMVQPIARGVKLHASKDVPDIAELIEVGRHVEMQLAPQTPLRLLYSHPPAFQPLSRISRGGGGICGIFGIMGVLSTGRYALCGIGEQVSDLVFGTIGKDPLEKIWREHPVLNTLREGLPGRLEGICGRCLMRQRCLWSCVAQNYYSSGNLLAPFWFCRQADEAGLFPSSRRI